MSQPFAALLDLDHGRLPPLQLRLDGRRYPVRVPEALPLADAFRLGDLFRALHASRPDAPDPDGPDPDEPGHKNNDWDHTVAAIAQLVVPDLPAPLSPGHARSVVAFYSRHLAAAVERLTGPGSTDGPIDSAAAPIPFSAPAPASAPRPASAPVLVAASVSNSPCP